MTLELSIPAPLESRLRQEAERQGLSPDAVTLKLLDEHLPSPVRRAAGIALLEQWRLEDEAMTPETTSSNADVLRAIDEDRLSDRKLFAEILNDESA